MRVLDDWAPGALVPIYRLDQMMAEQQQVVIVGGGVIGLLTAFNLATQGQAVVLLERAGLGQESYGRVVALFRRCIRGATARQLPRWRIGPRIFIHSWQNACLLRRVSTLRCIPLDCTGWTWTTKPKPWLGLNVRAGR